MTRKELNEFAKSFCDKFPPKGDGVDLFNLRFLSRISFTDNQIQELSEKGIDFEDNIDTVANELRETMRQELEKAERKIQLRNRILAERYGMKYSANAAVEQQTVEYKTKNVKIMDCKDAFNIILKDDIMFKDKITNSSHLTYEKLEKAAEKEHIISCGEVTMDVGTDKDDVWGRVSFIVGKSEGEVNMLDIFNLIY